MKLTVGSNRSRTGRGRSLSLMPTTTASGASRNTQQQVFTKAASSRRSVVAFPSPVRRNRVFPGWPRCERARGSSRYAPRKVPALFRHGGKVRRTCASPCYITRRGASLSVTMPPSICSRRREPNDDSLREVRDRGLADEWEEEQPRVHSIEGDALVAV